VSADAKNRSKVVLITLLLAALICLALSACIGSVMIAPARLLDALRELLHGAPDSLDATLVALRLTRASTAFVTGSTLALAGVLMQALLRNPLADPYVLGISSGAAVGALTAMLWMGAALIIDLSAFGGAVIVAGLLFFLAYKDFKGTGSTEGGATTLLLTGVVIGAGCMAVVALILSVASDSRLRSMVFWMIGDLSATGPRYVNWLVLAGVLIYVSSLSRAMNVAAMFSDNASTLGVSIARLRKSLFFCAALLTASAVSSAGSIGFVGLIIPHACRFAWGPDHRLLLPASCLAGGAFLMLADTLARTVIAPQQLPVGVVTALIGVPVFLLQLHSHRAHYAKS
jgi:iron complex transport system permease protein